jgi:hypothetical protein
VLSVIAVVIPLLATRKHLNIIFDAIILSRIMYVSLSWSGLISVELVGRIDAFFRRMLGVLPDPICLSRIVKPGRLNFIWTSVEVAKLNTSTTACGEKRNCATAALRP